MGAVSYVTTDRSGQSRIEHLRPGDYDICAVRNFPAPMLCHWTADHSDGRTLRFLSGFSPVI